MSFEFLVFSFEFPPSLPCCWGGGEGIQNSKFKIQPFHPPSPVIVAPYRPFDGAAETAAPQRRTESFVVRASRLHIPVLLVRCSGITLSTRSPILHPCDQFVLWGWMGGSSIQHLASSIHVSEPVRTGNNDQRL